MGATCASCTCNNLEQQTEYQIGIVSLAYLTNSLASIIQSTYTSLFLLSIETKQ